MKIVKIFACLFCTLCLSTNIYGLFFKSELNPYISNTKIHKVDLNFEKRLSDKHELNEMAFNKIQFDQVIRLNKLFAESIVHYWPDYNYFYLGENWIIFSLQRIERLFGSQNNFFGNHERFKWERVVETGFGLCSQISMALYDFLTKKNQGASIIALNGHVVVGATINEESYILDPDYDVVIRGRLSDIQSNSMLIKKAYRDRGYSESLSNEIVKIYSTTSDNTENTLWEYYPKYMLFYYSTEVLKWLLPILIFAIIILVKSRNMKSKYDIK